MRFRSKRIDPETGRIRVEEPRKTQIGPEVYARIEKLAERGVDKQSLVSALLEVAESAAPEIKADLDRRAPRMLRQHRRSDRNSADAFVNYGVLHSTLSMRYTSARKN